MRYSLDQIEAFVLAAKHSSISKAARILGKAQSTVSLAVANLEIDLGVQLFDRSKKYPILTDEGEALLAEAESVLFHCRVFEERSLNFMKQMEESIRICVDETLPVDLVGKVLAVLATDFPHVKVIVESPDADGVVGKIRDGASDIGLTVVNYRYPEDIGFFRLGQIRLVNVVGRGHRLTEVGLIRFSHLNSTRQIEYAPNARRVPTNQHLDSSDSWPFTSYAAIIEAVRQGLGWAILPEHLAAPYLESGELARLNLEAYQRTPWRINVDVVWSTRHKPGAVAWRLREFLGGKELHSESIE